MPRNSHRGMAKVRENGNFVDFEFLCNGKRIPVHRVVICGHSPVFNKVCQGPFKEAISQTYDLSAHPLAVVERMVEYMYTGDYSDPPVGESPSEEGASEDDADKLPVLLMHTTVAILADKYDIQGLVALSGKKYTKALDNDRDFERFLDSLPNIYRLPAEPSESLRDAAVSFARAEIREAMKSGQKWDDFQEMLSVVPEFCKELLCSVLELPIGPLMGFCGKRCKGGKKVPVEVLQCRCNECYKGGAMVEKFGDERKPTERMLWQTWQGEQK